MDNILYLDISFPFDHDMAIYPNNPSYSCKKISDIAKGESCNISQFEMGTHTGTHLDAPSHFIEGGMTVDEIPLDRINGPAKVVRVFGQIITADILGRYSIEENDIILFKTENTDSFLGEHILSSYTTLDYEAALFLADKKIKMVGIDYMTVERPRELREPGKSVHQILLSNNIFILESLDLRKVEEGSYVLYCFPLKLMGCDGSPVRAVLKQ